MIYTSLKSTNESRVHLQSWSLYGASILYVLLSNTIAAMQLPLKMTTKGAIFLSRV